MSTTAANAAVGSSWVARFRALVTFTESLRGAKALGRDQVAWLTSELETIGSFAGDQCRRYEMAAHRASMQRYHDSTTRDAVRYRRERLQSERASLDAQLAEVMNQHAWHEQQRADADAELQAAQGEHVTMTERRRAAAQRRADPDHQWLRILGVIKDQDPSYDFDPDRVRRARESHDEAVHRVERTAGHIKAIQSQRTRIDENLDRVTSYDGTGADTDDAERRATESAGVAATVELFCSRMSMLMDNLRWGDITVDEYVGELDAPIETIHSYGLDPMTPRVALERLATLVVEHGDDHREDDDEA